MKFKAFTIVEMLIVIIVLAILIGISVPRYIQTQRRAKEAAAKSHLTILRAAVERFKNDTGLYPASKFDLKRGPAAQDGYFTPPATGLDSDGNSQPLNPARFYGPYIYKWGRDPISNQYFGYSTTPPNVGRVFVDVAGNDLNGVPYRSW